jgi:hypothetical protein
MGNALKDLPSQEAKGTVAHDRLHVARGWKAKWEMDFRECYFFSSPHRQRIMNSASSSTITRIQDAGELNTDEAFILCGDFVTEVVNGFMSPDKPWCKRGPGMDLPGGENGKIWKQVKDEVTTGDAVIFNAMRASNLYPEVSKGFYPDLSIGTVALWIERPHPAFPIVNSAVPLREIEINLGPYGDIDDRFVVRQTRNCHVRELVGEEIWAKVGDELKKEIDGDSKGQTQVVWGYWRIWEDKSDEVWQHVVMVGRTGNNLVHDVELRGEGCCPLWIGRFNPTPDAPWGLGPLLQGLPSLRQIDEAEIMLQEMNELAARPPTTYPSASFSNVDQGFESGYAYPIQPGEQEAIKKIYDVKAPSAENFVYAEKVKKLRKLFFVDLPEQSGDTPPTRAQWMDEAARAQRRIGTPGMPFWRDLSQIFIRYKYLLEKSGALKPITANGSAVSMQPLNPTQAAVKLQALAEAANTGATLGGLFPEEFKMNIDGRASMEKWIDEAGVGDLLVLRPIDQVAKATDQMAKLAGARHVADPGEATPGPAA